MNEYKFGYNAFSYYGAFVLWVFPLLAFCVIPDVLYLFLGYMAIVMAIGFALTKKTFLTINSDGITVNYLIRKKRQVVWEDVGDFCYGVTKGSGKYQKTGWGIVHPRDVGIKMSTEVEHGNYALFIPENYVVGSRQEIEDAMTEGINRYVKKEKTPQRYSMDSGDDVNAVAWGLGFLCLLWVVINAYAFHLNIVWMPEEWEHIMKLTLVNGRRFDGAIEVVSCIWLGVVFLSLSYIPSLIAKKEFKKTALFLGLGIVFVLIMGFVLIPERHEVYLNCSEPSSNPIEKLESVVKENIGDSKHNSDNKMTFNITFEGKSYEVKMNYIWGAEPGMPITVQLKKGSHSLPIITKLEIPQAGITINSLGDAYNEISYVYADRNQYDKALFTIDKAIKLDSTEANYYDSKGEILFMKGDKKGAKAMWQKVISLEPDFASSHNSDLYRLLYGKNK